MGTSFFLSRYRCSKFLKKAHRALCNTATVIVGLILVTMQCSLSLILLQYSKILLLKDCMLRGGVYPPPHINLCFHNSALRSNLSLTSYLTLTSESARKCYNIYLSLALSRYCSSISVKVHACDSGNKRDWPPLRHCSYMLFLLYCILPFKMLT